jgi:hypothetical protein
MGEGESFAGFGWALLDATGDNAQAAAAKALEARKVRREETVFMRAWASFGWVTVGDG